MKVLLASIFTILSAALSAAPAVTPFCPDQVVDASTMDHKLLMGYQGWFTCQGDGSKTGRWHHWFHCDSPTAQCANMDLLPDTSELGKDELYDTQMTRFDGSPFKLYSAYNEKTVVRHFKWMKDYGIDGVMLQRFSGELADSRFLDLRDKVLKNVIAGAEANGRVFCVMYDISGVKDLSGTVPKDWAYLVDTLKVTQSPRYLRHKGKPLLAVWGFGFGDRPASPEDSLRMIKMLKENADSKYEVTLMGGVPECWREQNGGCRKEKGWAKVFRSLDVVSPWTVGRYADVAGADDYMEKVIKPDVAEAKKLGLDYMPVIFPGFSWYNMHHGKEPLNHYRRMGGVFYWRQVFNALRAGCTMIYGAMFDEVDEGTAMYKMVARSTETPREGAWLPLDIDGYNLPSDWYLKLCGLATHALKTDAPPPELMPLNPGDPKSSIGIFRCDEAQASPGAASKPLEPGRSISVNFQGGGDANGIPSAMGEDEVSGVAPAKFWNNASSSEGRLDKLKDGDGKKTRADVKWRSKNTWSTPVEDKAGNNRMMKGYLDSDENGNVEVVVEGLPEEFTGNGYSVIVYYDGDDPEASRKATYKIDGESLSGTDPANSVFKGSFEEATEKGGNYVVFKNQKGANFILDATPRSSTGQFYRAPVNGLQIVANK